MEVTDRVKYQERLRGGDIRLLTVYPGTFGTPVSCNLVVEQLDHPSSYEALSYTWGDPTMCETIWIEDKRFAVTKSAFEALQYMRRPDEILRIWVDAICINQNDIEEKNVQVQIMGPIYERATQTRVWLGSPASGLEHALDTVVELAKGSLTEELVLQHAECIRDVFTRSWFTRLWTLQEVVLSSRCVVSYGNASHKFHHLLDFCTGFQRLKPPSSAWEVIDPQHSLHRQFENSYLSALSVTHMIENLQSGTVMSLIYLLTSVNKRLCSDPRDRVFALRGMYERMSRGEMVPNTVDYRQDIAELFAQTTMRALLRKGGTGALIATLSTSLTPPTTSETNAWQNRLPSWVPQYTSEEQTGFFSIWLYSAGGESTLEIAKSMFSGDGKILTFEGLLTCSVDRVYNAGNLKWGSKEYWDSLEDWALGRRSSSLGDVRETLEALGRTLAADEIQFADRAENERWPQHDGLLACRPWRSWNDFRDRIDLDLGPDAQDLLPSARQYWEGSRRSWWDTSEGRVLAVMTGGHFSLCPPGTKPGDHVVVFPGIRMPCILRGRSNDSTYEMIGPAYVHGFMDGEAMEAQTTGVYELQTYAMD